MAGNDSTRKKMTLKIKTPGRRPGGCVHPKKKGGGGKKRKEFKKTGSKEEE